VRPPLLRIAEVLQQPPLLGPSRIVRHLVPPDAKQFRIHQSQGSHQGPPPSDNIGLADVGEHSWIEQRSLPGEFVADQQLRFERQGYERDRYVGTPFD
jgi:hypothetical protein